MLSREFYEFVQVSWCERSYPLTCLIYFEVSEYFGTGTFAVVVRFANDCLEQLGQLQSDYSIQFQLSNKVNQALAKTLAFMNLH